LVARKIIVAWIGQNGGIDSYKSYRFSKISQSKIKLLLLLSISISTNIKSQKYFPDANCYHIPLSREELLYLPSHFDPRRMHHLQKLVLLPVFRGRRPEEGAEAASLEPVQNVLHVQVVLKQSKQVA
jgi:hypothetical protein